MAHRRNNRRHRGLDGTTFHGAPEDVAEVAATAALEAVLAEGTAVPDAPSVREAKVARARALIADPGYPPKGVMDSVANLLANHLHSDAAEPGAENPPDDALG